MGLGRRGKNRFDPEESLFLFLEGKGSKDRGLDGQVRGRGFCRKTSRGFEIDFCCDRGLLKK